MQKNLGPQYIYLNGTTKKKFIDAVKNKEVDLEHISLPFVPMSKAVSRNPLIRLGITGVRHLQRAGGGGAGRLASVLSQPSSGKRRTTRSTTLMMH